MALTVCPVAVVAAPVEVVWANLVQWERFSGWADARVQRSDPAGPATPGQTISFGSMSKVFGRTMRFTFKVEAVDSVRHQLSVHAFFPLGLQQKAHISCEPIDATSCRVRYG